MTSIAAREALDWADSYSRMAALLDLYRETPYREWMALLGEHWPSCDNIGRHRLLLRQLLPEHGPVIEMMTAEELDQYNALPDRLTVFRGCGPNNMLGASWSLSRDVAASFPMLNRYRQAEPLLVTAKVKRESVLAVKLDRDELEIITFGARRICVAPLVPPPMR
ncbi:MAG: hypothetical protein VKI42_01575 [Synechococcaceae cyanobacterium]|nr:hypothetical protein [Synechococcaceae cyanobacterium]